jgi:hemolysin activation/secretion protein
MSMRALDGHRACSAIGLSLLLGGAAFAAEHEGQAPGQLPFELPPLSSPGVAADAGASALSATLVRVDQINFRGSRALSVSVLQAAAAPYLGRDLSPAEIEELRTTLTHLYTDRGYINSGVLLDPQAPYHDGVLSFLAVEGRIKQVRVHGQKGLRPTYVADRLRGGDDEPLNINLLRERFQRLLDDPLFARVNSRIEPGADLGEAILDVDVARARPYSLGFALNNYRPPSIGEKAYDLSAEVRDLTGFGDLVDVDLTGALNFSGGVGYSVNWLLPLNRHGTALSMQVQRAETVVTEEPLTPLDIRSTIERQELKLTQPLWSSLSQQFSLGASVAHEQNSTVLDGTPFSFLPGAVNGMTKAVTERLIPDYSYRSPQQYWGVRLTLLHAYLLDFPQQPVSYVLPNHQYFLWTGQIHNLWEIPGSPFELESRATLQRSGARISDLHALEIGGINSVRGFRENELLVSNVDNFNFDFRWLAWSASRGARPGVTLGTFFDWGSGHDVGVPTDTFSSVGLTWRLKWPHLQADFAYGARLIHPRFVDQERGSWQDHGIHAQLAAAL